MNKWANDQNRNQDWMLDFDIAWKEFNLKRADLAYPVSPDYEDSVFEHLQKDCSNFYNHISVEAEYYRLNENKPINFHPHHILKFNFQKINFLWRSIEGHNSKLFPPFYPSQFYYRERLYSFLSLPLLLLFYSFFLSSYYFN